MIYIYISNPQDTVYYGCVFDSLNNFYVQVNSGTAPTHLAELETEVSDIGQYQATIYANTETLESDNTTELKVFCDAVLDGDFTGLVTVKSDAPDLLAPLSATIEINQSHKKSIMLKLPTGSAWHGEKIAAFTKGMSTELSRIEKETRDAASIENMLFGDNLANWQKILKLDAIGTEKEQEMAVKRKLNDVGGLRAEDITEALHQGGFPKLYAYANKIKTQTEEELTAGDWTTAGNWTTATGKKSDIPINPTSLETYIPYITAGNWTAAGNWTTVGAGAGADLIVNSSIDDSDKWENVADSSGWFNCCFICGATFLSEVELNPAKRTQLRKLLLDIFPFPCYGILTIKYV